MESPILVTINLLMLSLTAVDSQNCSAADVCSSFNCLTLAAQIQETMDDSVNPCEDFFQYACGGWIKRQLMPPFRNRLRITDYGPQFANLRNLLNSTMKPEDLDAVKKAKNLYRGCLPSVDVIHGWNFPNARTIATFIEETFGVWPLTCSTCDAADFNVETFLVKATQLGVHPLFTLQVKSRSDSDRFSKPYDRSIIFLSKPQLGFAHQEYAAFQRENNYIKIYENQIFHAIRDAFHFENENTARSGLREIIELEINLASRYNNSHTDDREFKMAISRVGEYFFSSIPNWNNYLIKLLEASGVDIQDVMSRETVISTLTDFKYINNITYYFSSLSKRVQANYLIWRLIDTMMSLSLNKDRKLNDIIKWKVARIEDPQLPDESCTIYVSKALRYAVHRMLLDNDLTPEKLDAVQLLLGSIKNTFPNINEDRTWLDAVSKESLIRKANAIKNLLMYYDVASNDTNLNDYYSHINIRYAFIDNVMADRRAAFTENLQRLTEQYDNNFRGEATKLPSELDVRYSPFKNQIGYTSAGFLPPWYIEDVPSSINYAGLGFAYSHAYIQAFTLSDDNSYFNDFHNQYRWTDESKNEYARRTECLIDEYNEYFYTAAGKTINGSLTKDNNIADIGGLRMAYRAYEQSVQYGERTTIRGLHFSDRQLFFLRFAQNWCDVETEKAARETLSSPYSPNKFRVNGAVRNHEDFSNVFNCPVGSGMNPRNRCSLW